MKINWYGLPIWFIDVDEIYQAGETRIDDESPAHMFGTVQRGCFGLTYRTVTGMKWQ